LITDFTEAGYVAPEDTPAGSSFPPKSKCKRFSLNTLNPIAANALKAFDFDGNGKVTVDNVARGAEMLKDTQKKYKRVTWAMVVQFVVYAILAGASLGVLYYYLYLMKDMTVDETTGNLMIKTNEGVSDQEVSIKSHGETFSYDSFVTDPTTGASKGCVLGSNAASMFRLLSEGTQTKFMVENQESGSLEVTSLGNRKVSWTNTSIDLGDGFVLYPDADCTEKYSQGNLGGRKLSSKDLLDGHLDLRENFLSVMRGTSETNNDGRHLLNVVNGIFYTKDLTLTVRGAMDHPRPDCGSLAQLAYKYSLNDEVLPNNYAGIWETFNVGGPMGWHVTEASSVFETRCFYPTDETDFCNVKVEFEIGGSCEFALPSKCPQTLGGPKPWKCLCNSGCCEPTPGQTGGTCWGVLSDNPLIVGSLTCPLQ